MAEKMLEKQREERWLRQLLSGDHRAFGQLIDKYKETVFLCCRRLGLREDEVEDVASETFLAVYKGLGRYSGRAELSTWIWSIAYRQAVSYLRKNRRQWQFEDEQEKLIADIKEQEPSAAIQSKEAEIIVWEAVERLPTLWAMAIILYYREEKSVAEIAKIMRIRKNTIKTYLFRGREKLKQSLTSVFEESNNDAEYIG